MPYIDLVTAVERLAAIVNQDVAPLSAWTTRLVEQLATVVDQDDAPLSAWSTRERAIELLYGALSKAVLIAWVEIAPGEYVQLTGIDWATASLWRDILLGGEVRSLSHDPVQRYEGLKVLLDEGAFEAWRSKRLDEALGQLDTGRPVRQRKQPQVERAKMLLTQCFPPDGALPDGTSDEEVHRTLVAHCKEHKIKRPPSLDSVRRALGHRAA
jgi:hypothetical protein